jgi:hypothetical protein
MAGGVAHSAPAATTGVVFLETGHEGDVAQGILKTDMLEGKSGGSSWRPAAPCTMAALRIVESRTLWSAAA